MEKRMGFLSSEVLSQRCRTVTDDINTEKIKEKKR